MNASHDALLLERFRRAIARRLGLQFDDSKLDLLRQALGRRLQATQNGAASYLERMEAERPLAEEERALAAQLTIGETYFFRHREQFRALAEVALPDRLAANAHTRQLRLLSAGCASGEEAYSLAILLHERALDPHWRVSVRAVDVNAAALTRAARGHYTDWSLRETPAELRSRWFSSAGPELVLEPGIRKSVQFEERNLASDDPELWTPASYDIVFCRNVLMYFGPEAAQAVVDRLGRTIAPGGFLFLGHAETLRGLSQDFELRHTHDTFYYQRKDGLRPAAAAPSGAVFASPAAQASGSPATGVHWMAAVQDSAERIRALCESSGRTDTPACSEAVRAERDVLREALELLRQERFADALAALDRLAPDARQHLEALLLRAALLAYSGQTGPAETACRRLLEADPLNAGAHYLLALCRQSAGDAASALEHDEIAVHLDASFAMPRLHLGILARRAGNRPAARRALEHALLLLQREDPSRVLLFGGGFGREALIALCRTELAAAEAAP